ELAPLGQLVVELAIPERDITFTGEGQPVEFWLDSRPDRPWLGTIQRVHPRSEIRDAENVFIAEVSVDNAEGWLRPGMSGTARVDVGTCRLGWRMFHRVWEETRIWFGM
ncbi:MAG: HlyD family secretion protein, partial [Planctomycetaceae bacterium]|nr:HlyD family secretion protein [Planctomycetaceae bacterium]